MADIKEYNAKTGETIERNFTGPERAAIAQAQAEYVANENARFLRQDQEFRFEGYHEVVGKVLHDHENRLRALEGASSISYDDFVQAAKTL